MIEFTQFMEIKLRKLQDMYPKLLFFLFSEVQKLLMCLKTLLHPKESI